MAQRRAPLVLQAVETFHLGPGHLLTAGERLTVQEGPGLNDLLADLDEDEQRRRFGRVLLQVISEDEDHNNPPRRSLRLAGRSSA
jgi:hypothetical protein